MFRNTRNGAWYFDFFPVCFNFVSKRFETTETFGLSQFLSCFSPFQFFPYIIHCFSVSKHQKWGLVFSLFPELVSILFRNVSKQLKRLDLVIFFLFQSVSVFSLYNPLFQCFETPEMGPGIFTFFRACFNFVSKRFKTAETFGPSQFLSCLSLFQFLFRNTRNGAWYFDFFPACFNFVSKRFETTETFGLSQFLSCFSLFQFFPYKIHYFSVSKHQK